MHIVLILAGFVGVPLIFLGTYVLMADQGNIVGLILILVVLIALVLIFKDQLTVMINEWWVIIVGNAGSRCCGCVDICNNYLFC